MAQNDKAPVTAPAAPSPKRWRTLGILACVAGVAAAVVGLVGVLHGGMDPVDLLLFAGGMLMSVLGLRGMRRARAS